MTCTIDPDGRIIDMMDPFVEGYMISEVPVFTDAETLYTRWGDYFAWIALISSLVILPLGMFRHVLRRGRGADKA
jgi:apolipoprotein N-acyltransferase